MISFSQDDWACDQLYSLNIFDRLIDFLKTLSIDSQSLVIELCLLLLSNLTQNKDGVRNFLHLNDQDKIHCGVHFIYLMQKLLDQKTAFAFKFAANVLANISAVQEARETLLKPEFRIIDGLLALCNQEIKEIRIGATKTLRNLCFEYENQGFIAQIFDDKLDFVGRITRILGKLVIFSNLEGKIKEECEKLEGTLKLKDEITFKNVVFAEEIPELADIFLVLTNINELEKHLKYEKEALAQLFLSIRSVVPGEIKDKIDVILCIFCQINAGNA